jgi:hypothetical protein
MHDSVIPEEKSTKLRFGNLIVTYDASISYALNEDFTTMGMHPVVGPRLGCTTISDPECFIEGAH